MRASLVTSAELWTRFLTAVEMIGMLETKVERLEAERDGLSNDLDRAYAEIAELEQQLSGSRGGRYGLQGSEEGPLDR